MKIPLKVHNILDYVAAIALSLSPFIFGFSDINEARNLYLILGGGLAAYSLMTRYPISLLKIIPVNLHMMFDASAGLVLMAAPWVLGYIDALTSVQLIVHFVFGAGVLLLVFFTYPIGTNETTPARINE